MRVRLSLDLVYFWFYILYGKVCIHVLIHVSEKMGKEKAPISSNQIDLMRWGLLFIIHIIHRSSVIWGLYNLYGFLWWWLTWLIMAWFDGGSHVSCVVHVLIHSFMCSFMWVYVVCVVSEVWENGERKSPHLINWIDEMGAFCYSVFQCTSSIHHHVCNKADITLNECLYNVIDDLDVLLCYVCVCYYMCFFVWGG